MEASFQKSTFSFVLRNDGFVTLITIRLQEVAGEELKLHPEV